MLYSILPPILIVLSLVGIILMIAKKAPEAVRMEEESKFNETGQNLKKSLWGKFKLTKNEKTGGESEHKFLLMLEKITRKFKVLFLKLENKFSHWGDSIRRKRNGKTEENKLDDSIKFSTGKPIVASQQTDKEQFFFRNKRRNSYINQEKETNKRPAEKKNILEKILIDRIAVNPKDIEAYERLGEYYMEIESWEYAKECFKQVLKLDPQNANIKVKMKKLEQMFLRR